MKKFLENLKEKPRHIREMILYVTAPAITIVILFFWYFSPITKISVAKDNAKVEEVAPVNLVKDDFSKGWTDFMEKTKNTIASIYSSRQAEPIYYKTKPIEKMDSNGLNPDNLINNFKTNIDNIGKLLGE